MSSKLVLNDKLVLNGSIAYIYLLSWIKNKKFGSSLGPERVSAADVAKAKTLEDWEHMAATYAVQDMPGVQDYKDDGFFWKSRKLALDALAVAKEAIKAGKGKPWPSWAIQAKRAGWKAPKGWKP